MLLTLKPPRHDELPRFHEYSPPSPPPTSTFSPSAVTTGTSLPPIPANSPRQMSNSHRGLPPPAQLTLPPPTPSSQSQAPQQNMGQPMPQMHALPPAPAQWRDAEESMRNWLQAKQEEDRRKQEEEKTRQETLKLEQRRIEQNMLHDSLSGGIPPYMVPVVFASIGGGNVANLSSEWMQSYMAQIFQSQQPQTQQQPQQQQQPSQHITPAVPSQHSPDIRREPRLMAHPYGAQQPPQALPAPPPQLPAGPGQPQPPAPFMPPYQIPSMSPSSRPGAQQGQPVQQQVPPTSAPRPPVHGVLPRLNTGEMHTQPTPTGPPLPRQAGQQSQHGQASSVASSQEQTQSSPSIYFHHWQPPNSSKDSKDSKESGTPSVKSYNSPRGASEYTSSPKKRKAHGPHQPAPPPSSHPSQTSPSFSQTGSAASTPGRRPGHSRHRSDASTRTYDSYGRAPSRPHQMESTSNSAQPGSGTTGQQSGASSASMGDASGGASSGGPGGGPDSHQPRSPRAGERRPSESHHHGYTSTISERRPDRESSPLSERLQHRPRESDPR
ncbi:MAG: hypothetical protein M4579_000945 [Chaenotheca gracillima]|nr:MAG: hypothetical protein M4579_000945 [Chaenotheca gracillima]